MGWKNYMGMLVLFLMVAAAPLIIRNDYYLGVLVFAALNCLACIGLCLLMGYAGQISLGHAAFIGIGAYASGYMTVRLGLSPWTAMAAGIFLSAGVALIVGIPALRLKGHYLAMATLGFGSILHIVAVAAIDITGGPGGLNNIPAISLFGIALNTDTRFFYFSWAIVLIGLYFGFNLIHSRVGRGLRALHGSEDAAGSLGINTASYKIQIFVLSSVYASISGSLYAYYINYIDPGPFSVMHSVLLVTMVAVGGLHKIWGAVFGAVLLTLLPEFLSSFSEYFQVIGIEYKPDYDTLIYGLILLIIMLFLPEGLFGGFGDAIHALQGKMKRLREARE